MVLHMNPGSRKGEVLLGGVCFAYVNLACSGSKVGLTPVKCISIDSSPFLENRK